MPYGRPDRAAYADRSIGREYRSSWVRSAFFLMRVTLRRARNFHSAAMKVPVMKVTAVAAAAVTFLVVSIAAHAANPSKPSKPSSYAPQPHSKGRVYGAPIQPPIFKHRESAHPAHVTKNKKPATHTPRKSDAKPRKPTEKAAKVTQKPAS